jgi:hypothetical protein
MLPEVPGEYRQTYRVDGVTMPKSPLINEIAGQDSHYMEINPAKRALQAKLLGCYFHQVRSKGLAPVTVACLPGRSGWDLDYFFRQEEVERIICIERDKEIADHLREKSSGMEGVEIFQGEVAEYLMSIDYQIDLIYLDYCSYFNLSVMQDIDILLRREILPPRGRCMVAFINARESKKASIAQQLLFEDVDQYLPSMEKWEDIEADRRRCIAFNCLTQRYRVRPYTRKSHGCSKVVHYIGANAVPRWHRYSTVAGSVLTGVFTMRGYGHRFVSYRGGHNDTLYVRGTHSIVQREPPQSVTGVAQSAMRIGRDFMDASLRHKAMSFYKEHGYSPTLLEIGTHSAPNHIRWTDLIREIGLCPRNSAAADDVKKEILRIHHREGQVTLDLVRRARLTGRLDSGHGQVRASVLALLEELDIPYDMRTKSERLFETYLEEWVEHLECGRPKNLSRHYHRMMPRGFRRYEDSIRELRRIRKDPKKGLNEKHRCIEKPTESLE